MATAPESAAFNPLDVARLLRAAGGALFKQAALHGELARVEWGEEKARLFKMLAVGALVLAFSWDTTLRVPAAIAIVAVCLLGTGIAWSRLRALSAMSTQAFAATREELAADLALFKSKL